MRLQDAPKRSNDDSLACGSEWLVIAALVVVLLWPSLLVAGQQDMPSEVARASDDVFPPASRGSIKIPMPRPGPTGSMTVHWTSESGELEIIDTDRQEGWRYRYDTGFDRLFSVERAQGALAACARVIAIGWIDVDRRSRLICVDLMPGLEPVGRDLGITSEKGEYWCAASAIGSDILVWDYTTETILRFVDSDTDGIADTFDPSYVVPLDERRLMSSEGDRSAANCRPIRGFVASGSEGSVALVFDPSPRRVATTGSPSTTQRILETPGGPELAARASSSSRSTPEFLSPIREGRSRLIIGGAPGRSYALFKIGGRNGRARLSPSIEMSECGRLMFEIGEPARRGDIISLEADPATGSFPTTTVLAPCAVELLPSDGASFFREGMAARLPCRDLGDGDAIVASWTANDRAIERRLEVSRIDADAISVKLPIVGASTAVPRLRRVTELSLRVVNAGVDRSDAVMLRIRHD